MQFKVAGKLVQDRGATNKCTVVQLEELVDAPALVTGLGLGPEVRMPTHLHQAPTALVESA